MVESFQHGRRREHADADRRELDRQRHAVERPADARDIRGVVLGDVESRIDRSRAVAEQSDGRCGHDLGGCRVRGIRRQVQRVDVEHVLLAQPEPGPTRHQHLRVGQCGQQRRDQWGGRDHLLEVVEHDEVVATGAGECEQVDQRPVSQVAHPEPSSDRREHIAILAHLLEGDERHPVERITREARDLEGQAGLADPTGAHERDEPAAVILAEPREQRRHLRVPSDDTGRRQRERHHGRGVVGARCARSATARDASNRSARRVARSASMRSASSSAVEKGVYDAVSSSRIRAMSDASGASRSAGCLT